MTPLNKTMDKCITCVYTKIQKYVSIGSNHFKRTMHVQPGSACLLGNSIANLWSNSSQLQVERGQVKSIQLQYSKTKHLISLSLSLSLSLLSFSLSPIPCVLHPPSTTCHPLTHTHTHKHTHLLSSDKITFLASDRQMVWAALLHVIGGNLWRFFISVTLHFL